MRAKIVIYGEYEILDETEMISSDKKQLEGVATNLLKNTKDAETAEIYDVGKSKMIAKFVITRKGNVNPIKTRHNPNWGGARPGGGRKVIDEPLARYIGFRITEECGRWLDNLKNKGEWLRRAVAEKRAREEEKEKEGQ